MFSFFTFVIICIWNGGEDAWKPPLFYIFVSTIHGWTASKRSARIPDGAECSDTIGIRGNYVLRENNIIWNSLKIKLSIKMVSHCWSAGISRRSNSLGIGCHSKENSRASDKILSVSYIMVPLDTRSLRIVETKRWNGQRIQNCFGRRRSTRSTIPTRAKKRWGFLISFFPECVKLCYSTFRFSVSSTWNY